MPKKIGKRGCVIRMLLVILIGLLDLTPLGARTASAQTSPAPILSAVSPSRIALGGLIELIIEDLNAKVVQDKYDPNELHLSLNDYVLQGLKPDSIDLTTNKVRFRLIRTAADKTAWTDLLGAPPIDGQREVTVGLTLDPTHRVNTGPKLPTTVTLEIFSPLRLAIGMVLLAITIVGLIYLARTTDIVRDSQPTVLETGTRRPYSLARCQMAFWFFLVLAAFILIWLITGDYNGIVMQQTLVLMGISAATGAFSVAIDSNKSATATTAPIHSNFFDDLLTDVNGITLHRYQMLVWTIALGIIFLFSAYETLATPNFDADLLTLMGISSGTYLGFKLPEKQS